MDNYTKGDVVEQKVEIVFQDLPENFVHVKVKRGSKVRNLLGFAIKSFKEDSVRHMVFSGSGHAIGKVITCVEILKRKNKNLHQITKIMHNKTEDFWEPKSENLDRLKVVHDIPSMQVLLCKDQLDSSLPGYQPPDNAGVFWKNVARQPKTTAKRKRPVSKTEKQN